MYEYEQLSPLELFDYCVRKVREQGKPSMVNGQCAYRGVDYCKCGAGFVIPDEYYVPAMEGTSFRRGTGSVASVFQLGWKPTEQQKIAVGYAQSVHDRASADMHYNDGDFIKTLHRLAVDERQSLNSQLALLPT